MNASCNICIIGGGIGGLFTAIALSKRNPDHSIILLEKGKILPTENASSKILKSIAIIRQNFLFLETLGLNLSKNAAIKTVNICDSLHTEPQTTLSCSEIGTDYMGIVCLITDLYNEMLRLINQNNAISIIEDSVAIEISSSNDRKIITTNNGHTISTALVIASDGVHSEIANKMKFKQYAHNFHQIALTFHIEHDNPHNGLAMEKFMPQGPLAVLPLANPRQSTVIWILNSDYQETIKRYPIDMIEKHIAQYIGQSYINPSIITHIEYESIYGMMRYPKLKDGVMLVGNSLHAIHPITGYGFNLTIMDIRHYMENIDNSISRFKNRLPILIDTMLMISATHILNTNNYMHYSITKALLNVGHRITKNSSISKLIVQYATGIRPYN